MNTILVPLDGSLTAEHVLAYVRLLAPLLHAKIHLLRVIAEAEGDALVDSIMGHGVPLRYRERQHHALDMERQQAESPISHRMWRCCKQQDWMRTQKYVMGNQRKPSSRLLTVSM